MAPTVRNLSLAVLGALALAAAATASAQNALLSDYQADLACGPTRSGETCSAGAGRKTAGGGEKVSHKGWPAITGIFWQIQGTHDGAQTGTALDDELLGHHGSDTIFGGDGRDVIWGDWDPRNNTGRQRDKLVGGPGNDYIYPSHGNTKVDAGDGNDYIWAFYGKGSIDCGAGKDRVRVRLNKAFRLKNCETISHFCQFGSDGKGGCRKPGEKKVVKKD